MDATGSGPGSGWRSEEDYLFARLASEHGYLPPTAVDDVLRRQSANAAAGLPLTFSQVVTRDGLLSGEALLHVKRELARCEHRCPGCGIRRYLVPGPEPREEPCLRCSAPIPVSVTGSTVSDTQTRRRQAAINDGSRADGLAARRLETSSEERLPRHFGRYTLVSLLAKGAMGAVYRATDASGAPVAVKVLLAGVAANAAQRHRFRREAKAQSALVHPHIAGVRDAGEVDGVPYQVMDLVTGGDLAHGYADLSQAQRVRILAKVARAIEHAHSNGYIHRDLKLGNVLLTGEGEPKVTDFGLTKHLEGHTRLTQEGAVVGTPFYMSPEQVTGRVDDIGPRSDVYALGVMLYELVTGSLPFVAESSVELARMILEMRPTSFAEKGVLAPQLERVAFRALEKDPELRYPDAGAFALDLERIGRGEVPVAARVGAAERAARQVQRHRRSVGLLVAGTAVGLTVLIGVALGLRSYRTSVQRERAERLCSEALGALEDRLQATPWGAAPPSDAEALLLAAQRALDNPSVAALEPAAAEAFRSRLRLAMVDQARRNLRSGTNAGARRSVELVVDADLGQDPAGASLVARAAIRLGRDPAPALKLLPDGPEKDRLRGLILVLGGAPTQALPLLLPASASTIPFERAEARAWKAVALIGAGRTAAGGALFATLRAEAKDHPETLRRIGDLAALAGLAPLPHADAPESDVVELAERAAALRADASVDDDLETLASVVRAEDPRDLVPPSALAKAMRDVAWALQARAPNDVDRRAVALAERALLRRPRDLDLRLLRQKLDPDRHSAALKAEAQAALLDLSRPLGRGLFLSRVSRTFVGPIARKLAEEADAILAPVLERWPGLVRLSDELRALRGEGVTIRREDPLGWNPLLPPVQPRTRTSDALRARATREFKLAGKERRESRARIARLQAALRLDPTRARIARELALESMRRRRATLEGYANWFVYLRVRPELGFRVFAKLRREFAQGYVIRGFRPVEALTKARRNPNAPADTALVGLAMEYFGQVYPRTANEPPWPTRSPADLLRAIDAVLLRDPYLWGFLGVRGHLLEAGGDPAGSDAEFGLLARLTAPSGYLGNHLHRTWATARTRPLVAVEATRAVQLHRLSDGTERREVLEFLALDPLMTGIRETSEVFELRQSGAKTPGRKRKNRR